jgi:MOSC domain-containing protein YiiM
MTSGRLLEIYYASEKGAPMIHATSMEAITDRGLAGDRYERGLGTYSHYPGDHDVTLFEMEATWDFERFSGIVLHPAQTRRNLITEGVRLADLIDTEFMVGPVRLRGLRPCPPCLYLAQKLKLPILLRGLAQSGGIYASVVGGGVLTVGDSMTRVSGEVI